MESKQEINTNQETLTKKTSNNINAIDDIKENTISEIPSLNKIFSNANSIIMPNVNVIHIILKLNLKSQDEHQFLENLNFDDVFPRNDSFFISPNSNLGDSNFFSFCGDKSSVFRQFNENENEKDDVKSNFSFDSELEKQVGMLTEEEEDDDLNEAKLNNLENDDSNWSSLSVLKLSNNQHNMTTPVNKVAYYNESEDKSIFNNNMNITENTIKNNNPTSMIFNCNNNDNYNNIIKNNFDIRKYSSSSLYNEKTQDNHTKTNSINNYTKTNSINNYTKTNSINNITNMTNKTNNNYNNNHGIWNLKHGFNFNLNKMQFNNAKYAMNQSYDFHYNPCSLGFQNMKYYNNYYPGMNNTTQIISGPYQINNSNLDNININNELKSNQHENNNFNKPQNNFFNINNMNSKTNFFFFNNFNKSQLSMNSLNSFNSSNLNKPNLKINQNNFRGKNNQNKIKNYNEKLVLMIKSQNGSKSIQKKIEEKNNEFTSKLFEQIKNNLVEIINDQYGNYVIQKFVEHCDKKIISLMLKKLYYGTNNENNFKNNLLEISINPYGTRALQKMLDNLSNNMTEEDINILLNFSQGNIYQMMKDINGNHVIQSIIENIKNKDLLTPIYKEICDNIANIMKTKSASCCVFPKILNNIKEEDSDKMINCIIDNIDKLINDENANFAIQKIIKLNKNIYNNKIYNYIEDKIVKLSMQKFSSNVIETFIVNNQNLKDKIIAKLIESNSIINLLSDKFGNYIIQKSLSNANPEDFNTIIKIIKNNVKLLKQSSHGKKIYEKLSKSYKQLTMDEESLDNSNNNVNSINFSQNSDKNNKQL